MPAGKASSYGRKSNSRAGTGCARSTKRRAIWQAFSDIVHSRYVFLVGGLYGNQPALETILRLAGEESSLPRLVFNGDFNWFDVDDGGFRQINERVLAHDATLGNVEAELVAPECSVGCGCAYPQSVDAETVCRSNQIHARLRATAARHPRICERLASPCPCFAATVSVPAALAWCMETATHWRAGIFRLMHWQTQAATRNWNSSLPWRMSVFLPPATPAFLRSGY